MKIFRLLFLVLPWILLLGVVILHKIGNGNIFITKPAESRAESTVVLEKVTALGKLELVKYQFKEVVELTNTSAEFLRIIKLGSDSKAVLIAQGEAVGCIDLMNILPDDVEIQGDTLFLMLPDPELCYFKVDLQNTKLYSLKTGFYEDQKAFIDEAYKFAEKEIRRAALQSGILDETRQNAHSFMVPFLESVSGKTVILRINPNPLEGPMLPLQ